MPPACHAGREGRESILEAAQHRFSLCFAFFWFNQLPDL
jgi:hypothetical protein